MERKEKMKKFFKYFFIGITIFLFGFACWSAGKFNSEELKINAYAVEEENVVNLPFDFVSQDYQPQVLAFFQYNTSTNEYIDNYGYAQFAYTPKIFFNKNDLSYNITFNNYSTFLSSGILKVIDCSFYDYMNNFNFANYTLYNLKDYCSIEESYYTLNLNNISFNNLCILQNNSGILLPVMFIEGINNIDNNLTNTIIYDTTNTFQSINYTWNYIINEINYGTFKIKTNSAERNNTYSINGKYNYMPVKDTRYFYLTVEDKYQEGYNSGYEEGYNNAMEEMQNANIQNPFKNRWIVNAYAIRNNNLIVNMNNSDYTDVYGYVDNCIYNNAPVGAWAYDVNQNYNDISNYNLIFWANNVSEYYIDLGVNQILNIAQVFIIDDEPEYTNEIAYDVSVKLSILNAATNQTQVVSLNYLANDIINIDFTNINGVDYTYGYLKGVELQFTNYFYMSNHYCIRFNNYGNGNYSQGYYQGYRDGSANANSGYMKGYNQGYADASVTGQYTFFSLIGAVIDAPITYFTSLFNYEILGTNIKGFLLAMLTIGIVLAVIRISLAKK